MLTKCTWHPLICFVFPCFRKLSLTSLNSASSSSYQPVTKMARKNSSKQQQPPETVVISSSFKSIDSSSSAPPSSPVGGPKFPALTKSNSLQIGSGGKGNLVSKKSLEVSKRKSKRTRSASIGKSKFESQSCPTSRPSSSVARGSRPNSPISPRSPVMSRRALSFGAMKNSRSRQNSPSRSGINI